MHKKMMIGIALAAAVVAVAVILLVRNAQLAGQEAAKWELREGLLTETTSKDGVAYAIPPDMIVTVGDAADYPAITVEGEGGGALTSIAAMDAILGDEVSGIVITSSYGDEFYPYQILNWHYVVNRVGGDKEQGATLAIVRDVLTGNSVVYRVGLPLAATGTMYDNAMLLTDASGTQWWSTRGVSVAGALGQTLSTYPFAVMSWADFKDRYPNGKVLSSETGVTRDYTRHPYAGYDKAFTVYYPVNHRDARIDGPKWQIFGLTLLGEAMAFPKPTLAKTVVANETVGGMAVTSIYDQTLDVVRVFYGTVDKQSVTLQYDAEKKRITDVETGSVWNVEGLATSGTLKGVQLEELQTQPMFWYAWVSAYPETTIAAEAALSEDSSNTNAGD